MKKINLFIIKSMKNFKIFIPCLAAWLLAVSGCAGPQRGDGPFFGNGFRNGWADQHSIVLWTRLTKQPELNRTGPQFLVPSTEANKLANLTDKDQIMKEQIPAGYTLDQMEGACPGSAGEVKLSWLAKDAPSEIYETEWMAVDPEKDFTHQWKLDNLESGTEYRVKLLARRAGSTAPTDSIKGFFRTPPAEDAAENLRFCIVTCQDYPRRC